MMLKDGDKVKVLHSDYRSLPVGTLTHVVSADGEDAYLWSKTHPDGLFFFAYEFEAIAPKFAVGDRVRVLIDDTCGDYKKGDVVTVVEVDDDGVSFYDDDDGKRYLIFDYIEPVAVAQQPQLTIRAGAYYRTRDGRKVGPMRNACNEPTPWIEEFGDGRLWGHDGTGINEAEGEDLIAEWADEPAVAEPKFKVGDRVKFVHTYRGSSRGKEATVVKLNVWGEGEGVQVDQGGPFGVSTEHAHSLRLVAPATSGKPFKIGDRVVARNYNRGGGDCFGTIDEIRYNSVHASDWTIGIRAGWLGFDDIEHAPATTAQCIVALNENGQPKPATRPFVHSDREAATKEARRLAGKHTGKEFGVYELVDTAKEERVYEHEWQRLAASGRKIDAIKRVREDTGFTLRGAKNAVEHWLAVEAA